MSKDLHEVYRKLEQGTSLKTASVRPERNFYGKFSSLPEHKNIEFFIY